jgi:hypothetical protein
MVTFVTCWFALGEGSTDASQTQDAAKSSSSNGFEGLTAGSTGRQGFGQFVKLRWVHLRSLLST